MAPVKLFSSKLINSRLWRWTSTWGISPCKPQFAKESNTSLVRFPTKGEIVPESLFLDKPRASSSSKEPVQAVWFPWGHYQSNLGNKDFGIGTGFLVLIHQKSCCWTPCIVVALTEQFLWEFGHRSCYFGEWCFLEMKDYLYEVRGMPPSLETSYWWILLLYDACCHTKCLSSCKNRHFHSMNLMHLVDRRL